MNRFFVALLFWAIFGTSAAYAAAADLFVISGVPVDATAESVTAARDAALAQGRPAAWQRLFRRLTPNAAWTKQPQLDDAALARMIVALEVANERRSTTRYLGEVTYHFNPGEVQRVLRQSGVPYTETQAKPVLVIPVVNGKYEPAGPWAKAWMTPAAAQGLVPVILPVGDAEDRPILTRANLAQSDWAALAPLAKRYDVPLVVIAMATPDGNAAQLIEISAMGKQTESLAFARSTFPATAEAAALKIAEAWKNRAAVDYSTRGRLTVDVAFDSLDEWTRIRNDLEAVRSITDVEVLGLSTREARIQLAYYGKPEQLRDTLNQQSLNLRPEGGGYTLQLGTNAASAAP
jgi:hypothetical protein